MNLQRSALGDVATIGTLYDARTDCFSRSSLWSEVSSLPSDIISTTDDTKVFIKYGRDTSLQDRLELMSIKPDAAGSILADVIRPEGSPAYMLKNSPPQGFLHAAVAYTMTRAREKLEFQSQLAHLINKATLQASNCTHFVAEVEWGVTTIISFVMASRSDSTKEEPQRLLDAEIARLKTAADTLNTDNPVATNSFQETTLALELTSFTDLSNGSIKIHGLREALNHLRIIPLEIKHKLNGKGRPLSFSLLPLSMLNYFVPGTGLTSGPSVNPVSNDYYLRLINLFDLYRSSYQRLKSFSAYVREHKKYLPSRYLQRIAEAEEELGQRQSAFKDSSSRHLIDVRSGDDDTSALHQVLDQSAPSCNPCLDIESLEAGFPAKLNFITASIAQGAQYLGPNDSVNRSLGDRHAYIISISDAAMRDQLSWDENTSLFHNLLQAREEKTQYLIRDCGQSAKKCVIARYESGVEVVQDVCEEKQFFKGHSFARFREGTLETDNFEPPVKRRQVRIACPGVDCDQAKTHDWMCSRCYAPIYFGHVDNYIYCECGRTLYYNLEFWCKETTHGDWFQEYDTRRLMPLLQQLNDPENLNILILGETGVGKSTFINAFVNYLSYQSLNEAKEAKDLISLIPCAFSVQTMDRTKPDGEIKEFEIQIGGKRDDEVDGSHGSSATQKTAVYPITVGNRMIRLIDTPGIGDTRGVEFDKQNMADILSTLRNYDTLHGILILLKSNNSRLTVTFRFCVKELLTHLHRSAAQNMVFGFTNTRNANYTPGDTFKPLKTLLEEHENIGLSLTRKTTYCFDSESFRFLAAYKHGVELPHEQEFSRSWDRSQEEAHRLVEHFKSLQPHDVSNTLSLNGARHIITMLTKPMADITSVINTSIAVCDDILEALKDTRVRGSELRQCLRIQKVQLDYKKLDKPRTVCAHVNCVEYRDDGSGKNVKTTVFKTHCHETCYLKDVPVDTLGDAKLLHCAAFQRKDNCTVCGHHWRDHLHVLTEHEERLVEVDDPEIQRQLDKNATDGNVREAARQTHEKLIEEYKQEHKQIQTASARFGIFLKQNSITPYNDATLDYLDMLIKEEKGKVQYGGSSKRLEDLEKDRNQHLELVEVLTKNMNDKSGSESKVLDPAGIQKLVRELYSLKHFGSNLEKANNTIATVYEATNRERPFRVGASPKRPRASSSHGDPREQKGTKGKPWRIADALIAFFKG